MSSRDRESPEEEERTNSIPKRIKEATKVPQKKIPIAAAKKKITEESQGKPKKTITEVSHPTKKDEDSYEENYDNDK